MTELQGYDEQAAQIIERYGPNAVSHLVQLIEEAVRKGDDAAVERLDHLLVAIERASPKPPG
jgi:hypothetical protein